VGQQLAHRIRPDTVDVGDADLLLEWTDDESTRARILVDNPAELYRF
jgi:predicted TIM-barrel fold metal-dependent hydrolase